MVTRLYTKVFKEFPKWWHVCVEYYNARCNWVIIYTQDRFVMQSIVVYRKLNNPRDKSGSQQAKKIWFTTLQDSHCKFCLYNSAIDNSICEFTGQCYRIPENSDANTYIIYNTTCSKCRTQYQKHHWVESHNGQPPLICLLLPMRAGRSVFSYYYIIYDSILYLCNRVSWTRDYSVNLSLKSFTVFRKVATSRPSTAVSIIPLSDDPITPIIYFWYYITLTSAIFKPHIE